MTNLDANFKPGQIQTAFLVAMTNLGYLKMSLNEVWTNLEALNLSFYSLDKFRCSRFVLFKKDKFRGPKFVLFSSETNLDGLDLYLLKKDNCRYSKFVLQVGGTNLDGIKLSFLNEGQI